MNQENVDTILRSLSGISSQLTSLKRQVKRNEECIRANTSQRSQATAPPAFRQNLASDDIVLEIEEARPSNSRFGALRAVMAAKSISRTKVKVDSVTTVPLNDNSG